MRREGGCGRGRACVRSRFNLQAALHAPSVGVSQRPWLRRAPFCVSHVLASSAVCHQRSSSDSPRRRGRGRAQAVATALCPGAIDTDLIADIPGVTPKADRLTPETVAQIVAFTLALPNQASVPEFIANTRLETLI